jgi:hypothetical protein
MALAVAAAVVSAPSAAALAALPVATAAVGTPPDLTSFSVPAETVDCETSTEVQIFAHLIDDAGIVGGDPDPDADLDAYTHVIVNDAGTAGDGGYILFGTLVSGTTTDGTWRFGGFCLFKPAGAWQVTRVHLVSRDGDRTDISPASRGFDATFTTVGRFGAFTSMVPASDVDTTVPYGRPKTIKGVLSWYDTGGASTPIPGALLRVWEKVPVTPTFPDGDERLLGTTTTGRDGSWSFTWTPPHNSFRTYVVWDKGTTPAGIRYSDGLGWTQRTNVQVRIGLSSVPRTVPAGTVAPVQGNVVPNKAGSPIYLQRLTPTGWKTVSTATIRSDSTFTLLAQPPVKGAFRYRVYTAGDAMHTGRTTAPFTITGT